MHESHVPTQAVIAWGLWFAVSAMTVAGWAFLLASSAPTPYLRHWGFTLLLSAGVLAPAAAAAHIRLYTMRVCNLIRNVNGISERDDLRAVR